MESWSDICKRIGKVLEGSPTVEQLEHAARQLRNLAAGIQHEARIQAGGQQKGAPKNDRQATGEAAAKASK